MATEQPENPFAFPWRWNESATAGDSGMTLRDWFAGQALISALKVNIGISNINDADRERHGRTSRGQRHSLAIKAGLEARNG